MMGVRLVAFSALVAGLQASLLEFPRDFLFGAATAAYQIEGGWNVSDKSANIWDQYTHYHRELVRDRSDGDVACDSYHNWKRDIEMAEELGLDFYRFSIAWSRLMPSPLSTAVSEDGKAYYNKLIDGLLAKGIQPVVTLYHWDVHQRLQELGGWTNPLIVDWFTAYARVAYTLYADRVKTWITINEPLIICDGAYGGIGIAPGIMDPDVGAYLCNKNVLLAHAKAWRIYDEEFRHKYKGQVSLSNHLIWYEPATSNDKDATALAMEHCAGRYSHPIYSKEGGWPPALEKFIAEKSIKQGYRRSRLPAFTNEEIELVRGTYDFYGLNHYSSKLVRKTKLGEDVRWPMTGSEELEVVLSSHPDWESTSSWWFKANPKGFRKLLVWLKEHYGDIKFFVTENGYPTTGSNLEDSDRVKFYKDYLTQMLLAMKKDKVNVIGYTAWSLMDNFEWSDGYTNKFGLYEVNFTDPLRTRTPRSSASFYANLIKTHSLETPEESKAYIVWIVIGSALALVIVCAVLYRYCTRKNKTKMDYESVAMHNKLNQSLRDGITQRDYND